MAYKILGGKKYEVQNVTKRIYNVNAYFFCQFLEDYTVGAGWFEKELSSNTRQIFDLFLKCLYEDIGHLECEEATCDYIVEQGYNILGVKE